MILAARDVPEMKARPRRTTPTLMAISQQRDEISWCKERFEVISLYIEEMTENHRMEWLIKYGSEHKSLRSRNIVGEMLTGKAPQRLD